MSLKVIAKTTQGGIFEFNTMHDLQKQVDIWEAENIQFNLKFIREPTAEDIENTLILVYADLMNILRNQEKFSKDEIINEIKSTVNSVRVLTNKTHLFTSE